MATRAGVEFQGVGYKFGVAHDVAQANREELDLLILAAQAGGTLRHRCTPLLDGRPIAADRLDRELTRRANEAMNEQLGRTRLQIRLRFAPNIDYQRVLALQERCLSLGIAQVEVQR